MLRKIRTAVAIIVIAILSFGFIDFAGIIDNPWLQKIQFGPALLSLSIVTLVSLIAATLLLGRLYCSVVCPLGIFQDLFNWLSKKFDKKKKYGYKPERPWLRWGVLAVLVMAWLLGFTFLVGLVEPYSAYGRMADELFRPVYIFFNNILAAISEHTGSYRFVKVAISLKSLTALVVSALTLLIIGHLSYHHGRTWCNTICPVGTLLGFLSRFSLLRIRIDKNKCNHCLACQRKCKAFCIDSKNQIIDYSRCVDCFDCIDACKQKAISFGPVKMKKENAAAETVDESKRQFLKSTMVIAALAPAALEAKVTGKKDERVPMSPPGSVSHNNLLQHCTACHLCVSKCPSNVLKPAGMEYGLGGMMQPVMKFDDGYCNYDCNLCSQVCPAGAIRPLTVEEKHHTQPGRVVFNKDICVVNVNRTSCGACAEHCPVQAIHMVPFEGGLTIPETTPELCVGCGGCEYICPVKAVHIEGNPVHLEAKTPEQDSNIQTQDFDFGF
ncbi:MAG: 4Fe-4S dicluster domain-containing protein [Bacteroidaceae bacterium]